MPGKTSFSFGWLGGNRARAVVAAGVLAVAGATGTVAVIHAQQPSPSPSSSPRPPAQIQQRADDFINRLAQNLGVTPDKLRAALQQTALQEVDAALARGDITAQQAQQAKDRISSGNGIPFGIGFEFGRGGPGGPSAPGDRHDGAGFGASSDQLAQFLGMSADQLRTELDGKSLAQVAQAHGKTRDDLIQFLVNAAQQRLAADVQAGRMTQQQADQRLADLRDRIAQEVDQVHQAGQRPQRPGGR